MKRLEDFADSHLRIFERPALPADPEDVYLIGICGTGMGSLAGLFAEAGRAVSGSDANAYPPMSTRLQTQGIVINKGYRASNLDREPALTIVGNACVPTHPEATVARERAYAQASFPEALATYFIGEKKSVVVAGTHGKTTSSALLAHLFTEAGLDPGFLVGGVLKNVDSSFRLGGGEHFIVEGDEYDSAYFDKRPKFFHYRPFYAIITSIEVDHTDIYDDMADYFSAFEQFAQLVDPNGLLILNGDDPVVRSAGDAAASNVITYGMRDDSFVSAKDISATKDGTRFQLIVQGTPRANVFLPMHGMHNLMNTLSACAVAIHAGISVEQITAALESFKGIKRRQEVVGHVRGVTVIDDFAHHPTAVRKTIDALQPEYTRLVAIFEPRSNSSRRKDFQELYVDSFAKADFVYVKKPPFRHNDNASDFMDIEVLVAALRSRGIEASAFDTTDEIVVEASNQAKSGDALLIMSNGGFDGIHGRILARLSVPS